MAITLDELQTLLPGACAWAEQQESIILLHGVELKDFQISDAKKAGVGQPGNIKLFRVASIPAPNDPVLAQAAEAINLITPNTWGMTLRYGIFLRADVWGRRDVLVHECVHTAQYERLGGFLPFLQAYLRECVTIGYPGCPMEQEAVRKAAEICFTA